MDESHSYGGGGGGGGGGRRGAMRNSAAVLKLTVTVLDRGG